MYVTLWIYGDGNRVKKIMNQNKEDKPTFTLIYNHLTHYIPLNFVYCTDNLMISGITKLPPISMLEELDIVSKYKFY